MNYVGQIGYSVFHDAWVRILRISYRASLVSMEFVNGDYRSIVPINTLVFPPEGYEVREIL